VFQISRRTDYAVRIMLELGEHGDDNRVSAKLVARRTGVPKSFLYKISADLVKAGLARTFAGASGGMSLAKPAHDITMRDIVEAMEGPICLNMCLIRPGECPRDQVCPAHGFWGELQSSVLAQMEAATLDQLVAEAKTLKHARQQNQVTFHDLD
jgi:Rrf2 family protein